MQLLVHDRCIVCVIYISVCVCVQSNKYKLKTLFAFYSSVVHQRIKIIPPNPT